MSTENKYPWISFTLDLSGLPTHAWLWLGECVSKCRHISQIPLLPQVRDELHKVYLSKGLHATTAIEGNTLSEKQVRQIVDSELRLEGPRQYLEQEVRNVLAACQAIARRLQESREIRLTPSMLCEYNAWVLAEGVPCAEGTVAGKIRQDQRVVGAYRPPSASDVPQLLSRFCDWINGLACPENLDPMAFAILKAISAHLYIEWIHPFGDGNGRTGRLVEFALLLDNGVPFPAAHLLSNHYNHTRTEYYRQLDRTSKTGGDIRDFFMYAIDGFREGLQEVIDSVIAQTTLISWEHYVHERFRDLPAKDRCKRQRDVLIQVSRQARPMSRQEIEALVAKTYMDAGKRINTITRDLNELKGMGLLVEKEGRYEANLGLIAQRLPLSF